MAGRAGEIEDVQAQTAPHTSLHQSQQELEQSIRVAAQQLMELLNDTTAGTDFEGTNSQVLTNGIYVVGTASYSLETAEEDDGSIGVDKGVERIHVVSPFLPSLPHDLTWAIFCSESEERKDGDSEQARVPSGNSSSSSSKAQYMFYKSQAVVAGGTFNIVQSTCDAHCGFGEIAERLSAEISAFKSTGEEMHKKELEIIITLRRDILWMKWVGGTIVLFV
ncbi:hypothetical protein D9613_000005 [Agrocybe pediades]|uniref:Uncharacterized protein n=1 Tax=Agrocybe pediades TaxID=84607 RepID=A0A8H4VSD5_9AGAR|nr:hypothetical protein D9613_000005 [Agrocybe pediades]